MKKTLHKNKLVIIGCFLISIYMNGCSNSNAPKVNVIQTSKNGVLYGGLGLFFAYPIKDTVAHEIYGPNIYSGSVVSIVGASISTTTDSIGNWKLSGLDSGIYSIRFTHEGYDTLTLSNIRTNGNDSNEVKITPYGGVFLAEYIKLEIDTVVHNMIYSYTVDHFTKDSIISGQYIDCRAKVSIGVLGQQDASYEVLVYVDTLPNVSSTSYLVQEPAVTPRFNQDSIYFTIRSSKLLNVFNSSGASIGMIHNKDIYVRLYPKVLRRHKFEILPPSKVYKIHIP
ncbi:MAG: carboxypeptidase-like regulatory domain-containing protein [Bacteriodetes bacterium]|nr:carboxypeptidase-like regulatory domain-containing protein [Bacteroidota bacterium]